MRHLHQNSGTIAGFRITADRPTMLKIAQDRQTFLDYPVRLRAVNVGNKADTAGVFISTGPAFCQSVRNQNS